MLKFRLRLFIFLFAGFFSEATVAQVLTPAKWSFHVKRICDEEAELILTASIDPGFHVYSQFLQSNDGPVATTFTFNKSKQFETVGPVAEGVPHEEYDKNFEMKLRFFSGKAEFKQKIKIKSKSPFSITGVLNFMVCDDTKCLPPEDVEFKFDIGKATGKSCEESPKGSATPPIMTDPEKMEKGATSALTDPKSEESADTLLAEPVENTVAPVDNQENKSTVKKAETISKEDNMSAWGIFVAGFIGGLLALLTPCVFPMIPLTVSFFTKKSGTRKKGLLNALLYGVSIILIYVSLGMIITLSLGPDALNAMASNAIVNLAFFIIFVIFAISFLGAFEITLPSSWVNKADSASEKGGLLGIFFMAFTLSLVSFSCTGPIIGTLLVQAAVGGNVINPTIGMIGFSSALALPFGLFAAFPGWLNSLPKSGGWLNSVKVVLGLLELALALKFLSNVDLAYHWGLLKREVFIALWIIIFSILGFYLMGKIKFSHDSDTAFVSIPRLLFAIITFAFVVYLIPGMWGAPLKIISGFPPPTFYTEGWNASGSTSAVAAAEVIEGTDPGHCPHNLNCFHDYNLALNYAKKVNKPLMVDFTGWSCVNCRKMEDNVWVDPRVLQILREDFVLVSLYVDDKTNLPSDEVHVSLTTGKKVKTIGNKWSDFQTRKFGTNSQPFYTLLNHQEELLNQPQGYDPDIEKFISFLNEAKANFKLQAAK